MDHDSKLQDLLNKGIRERYLIQILKCSQEVRQLAFVGLLAVYFHVHDGDLNMPVRFLLRDLDVSIPIVGKFGVSW